jgi:hypothetical protein
LRIRSKSLDTREAAINGRDAALDERDRALSSRTVSLDDHDQKFAQRGPDVSSRQTATADREEATGKHESVCEERETTLAARESEIEVRHRDLEERAARVAEREAALDARSLALEARLAELSHRDQAGSNESIPTGGADQAPVHLDDGTNPDFLAAYMGRILARARRPKSEGDLPWLPSSTLVESDQPAVVPADARDPSNVPGTESQSSPALPAPLPEPSHRQDKDSVRAELDGLRHIANTAARSAIATYASKASREKMLFRTLFLTSSLVLAVVLLTSARWGSTDYSAWDGWLSLQTARLWSNSSSTQ